MNVPKNRCSPIGLQPAPAAVRRLACTALALCAAMVVSAAALAQTDRTGKQVVEQTCGTCHLTGEKGAPKIGDQKAWSARATVGLSSLTQHALEGIRKMPPHGGAANLSDLEIGRAVTYMVNQSGGKWIEPASAKDLSTTRSGEKIVKAQCMKCHEEGKDGAPRIGDRTAWAERMKHGLEPLVASAIRGHGGMPSRGGMADASDAELRSAILYMFNQGVTPVGGARKAAAK